MWQLARGPNKAPCCSRHVERRVSEGMRGRARRARWRGGGAQGAVQLEGLRGARRPRLRGSALFKRSSGACWRNAEQEERANTAQLHFYRMLCGKTPLTHTSAWQHGLSSGPGGRAALPRDHGNDLKGQTPQQAQATAADCTAPPWGDCNSAQWTCPPGWRNNINIILE